jgi:hypothetical protein
MNVNVAPFPLALFSANILPPLASIMLFEINNPKPVPLSDVVANFENKRGKMSGSSL